MISARTGWRAVHNCVQLVAAHRVEQRFLQLSLLSTRLLRTEVNVRGCHSRDHWTGGLLGPSRFGTTQAELQPLDGMGRT
jgi:hypothetical protein